MGLKQYRSNAIRNSNNVTGGLQDQCKFEDDEGNWIQFDGKFSTNHKAKFKNHGKWVKPVFPSNRSLQGSPVTPYIFDDRAQYEDIANALFYWWSMSKEQRDECGWAGREFCITHGLTSEQMGKKMIEMINFIFKYPKEKRPRFILKKVEHKKYQEMGIV